MNKTHISPAIYKLDTKEKRKIIITTDEKKIDVFDRFYTRTKKRSLSETTEEETYRLIWEFVITRCVLQASVWRSLKHLYNEDRKDSAVWHQEVTFSLVLQEPWFLREKVRCHLNHVYNHWNQRLTFKARLKSFRLTCDTISAITKKTCM